MQHSMCKVSYCQVSFLLYGVQNKLNLGMSMKGQNYFPHIDDLLYPVYIICFNFGNAFHVWLAKLCIYSQFYRGYVMKCNILAFDSLKIHLSQYNISTSKQQDICWIKVKFSILKKNTYANSFFNCEQNKDMNLLPS